MVETKTIIRIILFHLFYSLILNALWWITGSYSIFKPDVPPLLQNPSNPLEYIQYTPTFLTWMGSLIGFPMFNIEPPVLIIMVTSTFLVIELFLVTAWVIQLIRGN